MKTYELSYIVSPETTSEESEAKGKELESAIQAREGIILKQSNPIAKTLAFPIKRRASGFLGIIEFQMEPEKLVELKEMVAKDGKIVRHMVIIKEISKPKKIRRSKPVSLETSATNPKIEENIEEKSASTETPAVKEKVELKDIEQQLDEILGE